MNPSRPHRVITLIAAGALFIAGSVCIPRAVACLTSNIDKRTVQWSTDIVKAKLTSLGDKQDLNAPNAAANDPSTPSGKPLASSYRVITFEVTDAVEGSLQPGQTVKIFALIGGKPGDGVCPAMMKESLGKSFILMLRPFDQTRLDLPEGTSLDVPRDTMIIVSQLGEDDMNAETMSDLKKLVSQTTDGQVKQDTIDAQVEAVANAHDDTEATQAEKMLEDIGPAALPALQDRMKTAAGVSKTRLRRIIADVQPPMLGAEPE